MPYDRKRGFAGGTLLVVRGKSELGGVLMVEQYTQDHFTRHGTRVRSPLSQRRTRRLMRFALVSVALVAGSLALLVVALTG
jgi:hypothetical protein